MTAVHMLMARKNDPATKMVESLANAFYDDPFISWVFHHNPDRTSQVQSWMRLLFKYAQLYGRVFSAPHQAGAALWLPPGATSMQTWRLLRSGGLQDVVSIGWTSLARMMQANTLWETLHRQQTYPHWYLLCLGVDPQWQRQGIGSTLLQPTLNEADATGSACYLETTNPKNLSFYQAHGFSIVVHASLNSEVDVWTMKRLPRP